MKKVSSIWFFVLMVFVLPAMAWALVSWYEKKVERLPVLGRSKEHRIADFQLSNQDGSIKNTTDWKDKIVVADFFFTHCPVICPKMINSLKKVQAAWAGDEEILINSFTVDPERDSAAQLKKYCTQFGINTTNWDLLTGDKKDIYKLARSSFMIVATDGDGGPDDFIHSDRLVLIDKQKRIRGYYDGTSPKEINQLITDIKKVKDEN